MQNTIINIILVLCMGGAIFVIWSSLFTFSNEKGNLKTTANDLGLKYQNGGFSGNNSITGSYKGVYLNIYEEFIGSNVRGFPFTFYTVTLMDAHLPTEFALYPESFVAKIAKVFGGQDIQIDDPLIDNKFIIRGESVEAVRALFQRPNVKQAFLQLNQECDKFRVENAQLSLEFDGRMTDHYKTLRQRIELLVQCAHAIAQIDPPALESQPEQLPIAQTVPEQVPEHIENTNNSW